MREKKTGDLKIYTFPSVEKALRKLAEQERRSLSTYCSHVLQEHVALNSLKVVKQEIGGPVQKN